MSKYFNKKTLIIIIISLILSFIYALIFNLSLLNFLNGLTLLLFLNAFIALLNSAAHHGDFAMFTYHKYKHGSLKAHRDEIRESLKTAKNPYLGSTIILGILSFILNTII